MRDLLTISREIAAIGQTGLTFNADKFDRERFHRLIEIAGELLENPESAPGFAWPVEMGYPTPKIDVRCVVLQGDRVLLVKEISSGRWTVPGGWADVNLSPAQNAERECLEESGYVVKVRAITSVLDRGMTGYPPHPHAVYKIFVLAELIGGEARASIETSEVGFFPVGELPPLDLDRVSEGEIRIAYDGAKNPGQPVAFN